MQDGLIGFYVVTGTVAMLIGVGKGGFGGMLGPLITPLMSLVLPVPEAVVLLLPILIAADVFAVSAHWRHWDRYLLFKMLPAAIVGTIIGTYIITTAPPTLLRRILGILVLGFVIYKLYENRILKGTIYHTREWHGPLAGVTSGILSGIAHSGGPPISVYLLLQKIQPRTYAATAALYFATLNLTKVPLYLYTDAFNVSQIVRTLWVLPLLPVGVLLGRLMSIHIKREPFEYLVLALLLVASGVMLFT